MRVGASSCVLLPKSYSYLDVQLDKDDRTVVQPDVFGTCDPSGFMNGRYFGAPDLIIEVLSPGTRRVDFSGIYKELIDYFPELAEN